VGPGIGSRQKVQEGALLCSAFLPSPVVLQTKPALCFAGIMESDEWCYRRLRAGSEGNAAKSQGVAMEQTKVESGASSSSHLGRRSASPSSPSSPSDEYFDALTEISSDQLDGM